MERSVKLAENSKCCLCLKAFVDPRVLPCLHTFCLNCLEKTGIFKPGENLFCPVCESEYTIPEGGTKSLQKNLFEESPALRPIGNTFKDKLLMLESLACRICAKAGLQGEGITDKYCINCEERLCNNCDDNHSVDNKHLVVVLGQKQQVEAKAGDKLKHRNCDKHAEKLSDIYCTFCKVVICKACMEESHAGHCHTAAEGVAKDMSQLAEEEIASASVIEKQLLFSRENLHREKMNFLEEFKRMETEIMQRGERIKEMVCDETKAALKELILLKKRRLKEMEVENQKLERHVLTVEEFKEYCTGLKASTSPSKACGAELLLRSTATEIKPHLKSQVQYQLMPVRFSLNEIDLERFLLPLNGRPAIGRINVECQYKIKFLRKVWTEGPMHGVTILQDKVYLLCNSILIFMAETPFSRLAEIKIPDIKSQLPQIGLIPCEKLSCLFVYDKDGACIWKVNIADRLGERWLANVKNPLCISASRKGNVLIIRANEDIQSKVFILETYDEHAFLVRTLQLPPATEPPKQVIETPSGDYIICENKALYKVKPSGLVVCRFEFSKHPQCNAVDILRIAMSPYHIFVATTNPGIGLVLLNLDLSWYRIVPVEGVTMNYCADLCYIEQTKQLVCLDKNKAGTYFMLMVCDVLSP